jgi:outer membrane protein assembly factor BamB
VLSPGWRVQLHPDAWEDYKPQMFAQPVAAEDVVYAGTTDGIFHALDQKSGGELWRYGPVGPIASQPLLLPFDRRLYVGSEDGTLHCLNPKTGMANWTFQTKGAIEAAPAEAMVNGKAVVFVSNEDDHLYALDAKTGKLIWEAQRDRPDQFTVHGHSGPLPTALGVIVGFSDGRLASYDETDGHQLWETDLSGGRGQFVDIDTTPLLDGDLVYVSSAATGVHAVDVKTGNVKWSRPLDGAGPITQEGDRLYVSASGQLVVMDRQGNVLSQHRLGKAGDPSRAVIAGPYLMVSAADAGLYVLDKHDGTLLEFFDPGSGVTAPPAVDGNRLFALSNGGILYAFAVAD